jgi:vacuolar-type H+-ATPase subunit C/Vma6
MLEQALRRQVGATLRILHIWLGARAPLLAVATDAEDRRSLRAMIRGAVGGASAGARLAGLIPTPGLPERLLEELAVRTRIRDQGLLLLAARHPYARPILTAADERDAGLFEIEQALTRAYVQRARLNARGAGRLVQDHVRSIIDRENCRAALLLARGGGEEPIRTAFLDGGRLSLRTFEEAARSGDPVRAASILGRALGGADAVLLARHALDPAALEDAIERDDLRRLARLARLDPLGPAPALHFLQHLRLYATTLGRLLWSVEFRAAAAGAG